MSAICSSFRIAAAFAAASFFALSAASFAVASLAALLPGRLVPQGLFPKGPFPGGLVVSRCLRRRLGNRFLLLGHHGFVLQGRLLGATGQECDGKT